MLDQIRNGLTREGALIYVASAGAGLNMLAIGTVMSLIKPMPIFVATMGWFASGLLAGVTAAMLSVKATSGSERFNMLIYRASIGVTAVSLMLFARGVIGWVGAS